MTLAEFSRLLDADPKWVLNAMAALHRRKYSVELARRLVVARAIHEAIGVPFATAVAQATRLLRSYRGGTEPVVMHPDVSDVRLSVDVGRILSSFDVRLSVLRTTYAPRQRGRRPLGRRDPLRAAAEWGYDLTLVAANLRKTAEERLRQLDAMSSFAREVRRSPASAR